MSKAYFNERICDIIYIYWLIKWLLQFRTVEIYIYIYIFERLIVCETYLRKRNIVCYLINISYKLWLLLVISRPIEPPIVYTNRSDRPVEINMLCYCFSKNYIFHISLSLLNVNPSWILKFFTVSRSFSRRICSHYEQQSHPRYDALWYCSLRLDL